MHEKLQTLFVFVDGLGLGIRDAAVNPLYRGDCPFLLDLVENHALPVDASLDLPGLPQSATGQATLFTGVNAAKHLGRHMEGCPGPTLKKLVRENNLYEKLEARGCRCTFANAYYIRDLTEVQRHRRQSVSTVAALKAFGAVRDEAALVNDEAVYQDLTRHVLRKRGYDGPLISPEEAARHLLAIAAQHHFTVFEYFQTDLVAHRGTAEDMQRVLSNLDAFLRTVLAGWGDGRGQFIMLSDHGNLEDSTTRGHTHNPVPLVALGEHSETLRSKIKRLEDFAPAVMDLYGPSFASQWPAQRAAG